MLKDILDRIESRLQALDLTASAASTRAGLSKDAIRNIQRAVELGKEGGASTQTLTKLAPVLQTTASWLLEGDAANDNQPVESGLRKVIVAAYVQAGVWTETWEWGDDDQYAVFVPDDPAYRKFKLFGAEARGPSMNRRYPEGTVLVFADVQETGEQPIAGKRYVVERRRPGGEAEHTVKLLHIDDDGKYWLLPESDDPRYQAPIAIEDGTGDDDTVIIIGRVCYAVSKE